MLDAPGRPSGLTDEQMFDKLIAPARGDTMEDGR